MQAQFVQYELLRLNEIFRDFSRLLREETNDLLKLNSRERTEKYYQQLLLNKNNSLSSEQKLIELTQKLLEMEGYKNSKVLAAECEQGAFKMRYTKLFHNKNNASTEKEYQDLAKKFR